jgi:hypothetical protein
MLIELTSHHNINQMFAKDLGQYLVIHCINEGLGLIGVALLGLIISSFVCSFFR